MQSVEIKLLILEDGINTHTVLFHEQLMLFLDHRH